MPTVVNEIEEIQPGQAPLVFVAELIELLRNAAPAELPTPTPQPGSRADHGPRLYSYD